MKAGSRTISLVLAYSNATEIREIEGITFETNLN